MLLNLLHNVEIEQTFPNSFYERSVSLLSKQDKDTTKESIDQKFLTN